MDNLTAIIGGTGLVSLEGLERLEMKQVETPYGKHSNYIALGDFEGQRLIFLARHNNPHSLPPHLINYRANIWALKQLGVSKIIAVNAVGGINPDYDLAQLVINDQIVDYTYDRPQTFFEDKVHHIDFTFPFDESLRQELIAAAMAVPGGLKFSDRGCYGCTQGPRLESAAEIRRMSRDGCDVVGMTAMPEASLARELDLLYASISMVVNKAAGLDGQAINIDAIAGAIDVGVSQVLELIRYLPENQRS